jgi:hypothetical protein
MLSTLLVIQERTLEAKKAERSYTVVTGSPGQPTVLPGAQHRCKLGHTSLTVALINYAPASLQSGQDNDEIPWNIIMWHSMSLATEHALNSSQILRQFQCAGALKQMCRRSTPWVNHKSSPIVMPLDCLRPASSACLLG